MRKDVFKTNIVFVRFDKDYVNGVFCQPTQINIAIFCNLSDLAFDIVFRTNNFSVLASQ